MFGCSLQTCKVPNTASMSCSSVSLPTDATVGTTSSSQPPMLLLSTSPFTPQVSTDAAGAGMTISTCVDICRQMCYIKHLLFNSTSSSWD